MVVVEELLVINQRCLEVEAWVSFLFWGKLLEE